MIHPSRNRFIIAAAALIILALFWRFGPVGMRSPAPAVQQASHSEAGSDSADRRDASKPAGDRSSKTPNTHSAEAKLKSLLEVRRGEIAFIRVPGGGMTPSDGKLWESALPDPGQGLSFARVKDKAAVVEELLSKVAAGMPVQGDMDASDDSFQWELERWKVEGRALHSETDAILQLKIHAGEQELVTMITMLPGDILVLNCGGEEQEALLLVVGGGGRGTGYEGDIPD